MDYREFDPVAALAPYVDRLWTLVGPADVASADGQVILPDGRPELVLHFGDPFERVEADGSTRQASVLLAGQLMEQLVLRPTGRVAALGVRFHPFGAAACFQMPQHQLVGCTPAVEDLSPALAASLARVRSQTDDVSEATALVQQALVAHVDGLPVDPRIRRAAALIERSGGRLSIDTIAAAVDTSRRHLERQFLHTVGLGPKRLARIARFQRALRVLGSGNPESGAATAASCGYADQPHFIREFRRLAGCAPSEHLLRQGELTGFFIGGESRPGTVQV
jgi:AraC-like DNA-binding protein